MGAWLGKMPNTPAAINGSGGQFSSYEAACRLDPEIQSFDATLQQRTSHAISTLPIAGDVGLRSLSFDSLREVTSCLLDVNQEVVKVILDCKKDIWKNPELFDLVEEYFDCSLQTLDFCTALEKCLKKARDSQLVIQLALRQFDAETEEMQVGENGKKYARTMDELNRFKAMGDPFTADFFIVLESVYKRQLSMYEKVQQSKSKLDKKLKSVKAWRKVSSIILAATFAAVLICSVVAAAVAAPPVAAALAAAAAIPIGSMGKWINSLLKEHHDALKGQREVFSSMQLGTYLVINDLKNIQVLVDQLEVQITSLLDNAEFALRDEEAVKFGIEEIKKKLGVFMNIVESLGAQADQCSRDVRRARTVVLQRIIKHPS